MSSEEGLPDGIPAKVYTEEAAVNAVALAEEAVTWVKELIRQAKGITRKE